MKSESEYIKTLENEVLKLESQLKERDFGKYLINALPSVLVEKYRKDFLRKTKKSNEKVHNN